MCTCYNNISSTEVNLSLEVMICQTWFRSSSLEVFTGQGVLKICSKCTGEHLCRKAISVKLPSTFIEVTLLHGCFPVNFLHIFKTPFPKNTSGGLHLLVLSDWLLRFLWFDLNLRCCNISWAFLSYIRYLTNVLLHKNCQ